MYCLKDIQFERLKLKWRLNSQSGQQHRTVGNTFWSKSVREISQSTRSNGMAGAYLERYPAARYDEVELDQL